MTTKQEKGNRQKTRHTIKTKPNRNKKQKQKKTTKKTTKQKYQNTKKAIKIKLT